MNCFPCFQCQKSKKALIDGEDKHPSDEFKESKADAKRQKGTGDNKKEEGDNNAANSDSINAQAFTFRELATATKNFRQECLLGEGGFGRVYKGTLRATEKVVAVKQLDRNGMQHENKEFLDEVCSLSHMAHENLVNLVGYCADGDQRLLVYEFMSGGSVEDHVLDMKEDQKPLDWMTRMKIAYGAAQGLEYLHDKVNPPVVYRDLKSSNILLDNDLNPKLSDFGLAKLNPTGDKMHISPRVMGTYGYSAPEYARTGQCTIKSDVYSFGVVMLELITGRRAIDTTRSVEEQNLVAWAQPIFRDPKRFPDMADPLLRKKFPERGLNQAVAISAMCLQEEPGARPLMSDVVTALSFLSLPTEKIPDSPIESSDDGLSTEEGENENGEVTDENEMYSSGSDYDDAEEHKDEKLDYQEGDEEEEGQQSARQSQKWYSDSTNNVSRKRSLDHKSASSSVDESNKVSQNEKETENISSINRDNSEGSINNNNNNNENGNGNVISREKSSSKGSGDLGMKSLFTSLSRKSSKGGSKKEEKSASIKKKNRKRSSSLVAHKRSRKTQQQEGVTISSNHSRSMNSLNVVADDVKNVKEKSTAEPSSKNVTQEESSKSSEVVDSLHQNSQNISIA